jgi:hypothetical protein
MINHPKYPNGNIYLSGGMQFAENEGADWRRDVSKWLKETGYFPLDICALDQAYAAKYGHFLRNINKDDYLQRKSNIRKHFIETDLNLVVNDSDALFVLYDESVRRGAGTISECQIAFSNDIPVFVISAWEDWENEVPGWLQALSTKIFTSFTSLEIYMKQLPPGIIKRDVYGNHSSGEYYLCSLSGDVFKKSDMHFVSKVSPLYSKDSVSIIRETHEQHVDRYKFILQHLENEAKMEMLETKGETL